MRLFSSLGRRTILSHRSTRRFDGSKVIWNRLQVCCWIHLFSLSVVTRPVATLPVPFDLHRGLPTRNSITTTAATATASFISTKSTRSLMTPTQLEASKTVGDDEAMDDDKAEVTSAPRRSTRKRKTRGSTAEVPAEPETDAASSPKRKVKVKVKVKRKKSKVKGVAVEGKDDTEESDADSVVSSDDDNEKATKKKSPAKKKKQKAPTKVKGSASKVKSIDSEEDEGSSSSSDSEGKAKKKKKKSPTKKKSPEKEGSPKKKKASDHQRQTERDEIPKLWDAEKALAAGSYTFKIASWNVAGLRAIMRKDPDALSNLCKKHDLDMLCLQETKLQETHVDDPKLKIRGCLKDDGYDDYWSCSASKKGYSGTAVFIKQRGGKISKQSSIKGFFAPKTGETSDNKKESKLPVADERLTPSEVSYNIGKEIDSEGRTVIVDLPFATITNVYVPNAGQTLQRLEYRTEEWDKDFLEFMQKKQDDRGLPVIWLGDLNIAHKAYDVWNDGAKHLAKQAGVTPQERESFQSQLDSGFVDAFRKLHPEAKGHYSYWSQRAGNREPNKGLRLDYFICSPQLFSEDANVVVRDSYFDIDQFGSDHCPAVLELEIKKDK